MDDREQFRDQQRTLARELAADADLVHHANELQVELVPRRYTYMWNWLGVPIIQLPVDIVVLQEIVWETRPDVIIETGVARGGSLVFFASMLALLGEQGRVIGIDIDIREHNRQSIEEHPLGKRISLVQGSSSAPDTLRAVTALVEPGAKVMVVLDSDHTHEHVLAELRAYAPLVTENQFLVVADTGVAMPEASKLHFQRWSHERNPNSAMQQFLSETSRFRPDEFYNAKLLLSSSPGGYLRCSPEK